jgi:hypothetical protein
VAAVGLEPTTYGLGTARLARQKRSRDRRNMDKGLVAAVGLEATTYGPGTARLARQKEAETVAIWTKVWWRR